MKLLISFGQEKIATVIFKNNGASYKEAEKLKRGDIVMIEGVVVAGGSGDTWKLFKTTKL